MVVGLNVGDGDAGQIGVFAESPRLNRDYRQTVNGLRNGHFAARASISSDRDGAVVDDVGELGLDEGWQRQRM
jgi:hypothetical protein